MKKLILVALVLAALLTLAVSAQASPVRPPLPADDGKSFTVWFISQNAGCYYINRQDVVMYDSVTTTLENDCVTLQDATEKLYGLTHY